MAQLNQSTRRKVFDRHGHECIFCGVTGEQHKQEYDRDLDVHHVIPSRKGGSDDPENLIPVCIGCHRTIEATQGEALGRISENEGSKKKIKRLESKIERLQEKISDSEERTLDILDGVEKLLENNLSVKLYVVHETRFTTSRLLYVGNSIEDAQEAFEQSENHVTMETVTASASDWVSDLSDTSLEIVGNESKVLEDRIRDYREALE